MHFSPATYYYTDHKINQDVGLLFDRGFDAERISTKRANLRGLSIVYGILRGTAAIIKDCEKRGLDYLYCDHSYFDACRVDYSLTEWKGYYRVIPNHRYFQPTIDMPSDRWDSLGIKLKPWRKGGDHIVVIPITRWVGAFYGIDPESWLKRTLHTLKQHTDREIVVKQKDLGRLRDTLEGAWALVTFASNAAVEAAIQGIPIFTSPLAAAWRMADHDLLHIEAPRMPDRGQSLYNLAYQQFTPKEIVRGTARSILKAQFQPLPEAA